MREAGEKVAEGWVEMRKVLKLHFWPHLQHWQHAQLSVPTKIHQVEHLTVVHNTWQLQSEGMSVTVIVNKIDMAVTVRRHGAQLLSQDMSVTNRRHVTDVSYSQSIWQLQSPDMSVRVIVNNIDNQKHWDWDWAKPLDAISSSQTAITSWVAILYFCLFGQFAQVVQRQSLDREVKCSNPSRDTMALLLGRHYVFPQCGIIIKGKLLLLLKYLSNTVLTAAQ
jgi:hypothetical protein